VLAALGALLALLPTRSVSAAEPVPTADSLARFPPPRVRAWQVGLARGDRLQHTSMSFALASALTLIARDRRVAAGVTLALGVGKELWDERGDRFDPVDLSADATGIVLAAVAVRPRGR